MACINSWVWAVELLYCVLKSLDYYHSLLPQPVLCLERERKKLCLQALLQGVRDPCSCLPMQTAMLGSSHVAFSGPSLSQTVSCSQPIILAKLTEFIWIHFNVPKLYDICPEKRKALDNVTDASLQYRMDLGNNGFRFTDTGGSLLSSPGKACAKILETKSWLMDKPQL